MQLQRKNDKMIKSVSIETYCRLVVYGKSVFCGLEEKMLKLRISFHACLFIKIVFIQFFRNDCFLVLRFHHVEYVQKAVISATKNKSLTKTGYQQIVQKIF